MNASNKIRSFSLIPLLMFSFLKLACSTSEENTTKPPPPVHETIQIASPQNHSSFTIGEKIPFELKQPNTDMQDMEVYLNDQRINVNNGEMLDLSIGEHILKLVIDSKTIDEVTFNVTEAEYTFRFKFNYLNREYYDLFPSACLPKKGIQTSLTKQDDSEWKDFLPKIFTMSKEWDALAASWQEGHGFPPCLSNRDEVHTNEVFIDFHIKANRSKHVSKPIQINFEFHREWPSVYFRTGLLIRSLSEMKELLSYRSSNIPIEYRIDFSKKSILTLKGPIIPIDECSEFSGCGLASIYDNLAAIYEWNNKLYIMTKVAPKEILYPRGDCAACLEGFHSILILDYAKDLPVEFIEIP